MAANYSLLVITVAIPGHSGLLRAITGHSGRSPVSQITHDRRWVCFLANNFEGMRAAALRDQNNPFGTFAGTVHEVSQETGEHNRIRTA